MIQGKLQLSMRLKCCLEQLAMIEPVFKTRISILTGPSFHFHLLELSTSNFNLLLEHFFIFTTYFEISRLFSSVNCLSVVFESWYIFMMCSYTETWYQISV